MVSTAGGIVIAIIILALAGALAWVTFTQLRARKLGLPAPSIASYIPFYKPDPYGSSSASGGSGPLATIKGWFGGRNARSATGAYEQPGATGSGGGAGLGGNSSSAGRRGFGPLDPDDAWDARVGHEADSYGPYGAYDEQELGDRGRSAGHGYPSQVHRGGAASGLLGSNPFDDDAEPSNIGGLRGVSPRPIDTGAATQQQQQGPKGGSPTERRSMFRENLPAPSIASYIPFYKPDPYGSSSSSSGGSGPLATIKGWFGRRNARSAAGAYEQSGATGGGGNNNSNAAGRRGFGPLDPDDAWDARVGHEADSYGPYGAYDEQELGDRGRSAGHGYPSQVHRGGAASGLLGSNPFDDDAEPSNIGGLRGVSPRPIDTGAATQQQQQGPKGGSPTERRSMFRENV
ncbi:hypothetical protein BN1708_006068 [Verticillium longisporum]|uniref:Uncharacterized protein n=1 Tax=Verticillium longisporum TaxID=100787 RepID=A0A0G4MH40_VERLO|nr:hypothetical protein BN1708_006068 [Verticillium longisporum]